MQSMSLGRDTQQVHRFTPPNGADVGVDLGGLERLVPEQRLDDAEVGVAVEELGCKCVAKEMRVEAEAEPSAGARYRIDDGPRADAASPGDKERIARPEWVPRGQIG